MIPARRNRVFDALFYLYLRRKLAQRFHGVYLRGFDLLRLPADRPVIAYANHTNWWDLLMLFRLTRAVRKTCYGMMEEKHLRRYPFLRAIGGFGIDLERADAAALRYALRLLEEPRNLLWILPQGRLATPYEPLEIRPGLPFLCRHAPRAVVLPVAFRYEFFRDDLPVALIEIGAPLERPDAEALRAAGQAAANRLEMSARAQDLSGFTPLLAPRLSINKKWERFCRFLTGRLDTFDPSN